MNGPILTFILSLTIILLALMCAVGLDILYNNPTLSDEDKDRINEDLENHYEDLGMMRDRQELSRDTITYEKIQLDIEAKEKEIQQLVNIL